MKPSQLIPALWQWFFAGGPPPVPWLVYARPGAARYTTRLTANQHGSVLTTSRHPTRLAASQHDPRLYAVGVEAGTVTEGVIWTDVAGGLVIAGNLATMPVTNPVVPGTARAEQLLTADGHYVEFRADQVGVFSNVYFGITPVGSWNPSGNPPGVYAVSVIPPQNRVQINDGAPHNFAWAPNDIIRIAVESGSVNFYSNGALLYGSLGTPSFPLLAYVKLYFENTRVWADVQHIGAVPLGGHYAASRYTTRLTPIVPALGAILVTVRSLFGVRVADAPVIVCPGAAMGVTDGVGECLLSGLAEGAIVAKASTVTAGGTWSGSVVGGVTTPVDITLDGGPIPMSC